MLIIVCNKNRTLKNTLTTDNLPPHWFVIVCCSEKTKKSSLKTKLPVSWLPSCCGFNLNHDMRRTINRAMMQLHEQTIHPVMTLLTCNDLLSHFYITEVAITHAASTCSIETWTTVIRPLLCCLDHTALPVCCQNQAGATRLWISSSDYCRAEQTTIIWLPNQWRGALEFPQSQQ